MEPVDYIEQLRTEFSLKVSIEDRTLLESTTFVAVHEASFWLTMNIYSRTVRIHVLNRFVEDDIPQVRSTIVSDENGLEYSQLIVTRKRNTHWVAMDQVFYLHRGQVFFLTMQVDDRFEDSSIYNLSISVGEPDDELRSKLESRLKNEANHGS